MAVSGRVTIGKVVASLQATYPDLTISKVRYLENEGLLTPARTEGKYRLYSQADIDRLEKILYLQKNRFLPLAVIRRMIENGELEGDQSLQSSGEIVSASLEDPDVVGRLHQLDRMPDLTGASVSFVRSLADAGVIEFKKSPQGKDLVDGKDLSLIRTADELRKYGIEPKHLRPFVISARREASLFEQALSVYAGRGGQSSSDKAKLQSHFEALLQQTGSLRNQLIRRSIRDTFFGKDGS